MKRNVIITGASTGLGLAVSVAAAVQGYKVHATMRDTSKKNLLLDAAAGAGVKVNIRQMDVEDSASVNAAIGDVIKEDGGVHALVNNAGMGFVRTTEQASEADIDRVMNVNFMGVVRCTKAVLPAMRAARSGRVINITSVGGLVGQPFNEIYCASKFAVEGYTESLACYVGPEFNLHFSAVEPGGIASEFATSAMKHFAATGGMIDDEYAPLLNRYIAGVTARAGAGTDRAYQTADEVAAIIVKCLVAEKPPVRIRTSEWGEKFSALKTASDPDGTKLQEMIFERFFGSNRTQS